MQQRLWGLRMMMQQLSAYSILLSNAHLGNDSPLKGLTLPFSGAANDTKIVMRDWLRGLRCNGLLDSPYCQSPRSSRQRHPRCHSRAARRPAVFAPPSGGGYLTTDDSRTANAACAARRHVSASASDLPLVDNLRLSNARVHRARATAIK